MIFDGPPSGIRLFNGCGRLSPAGTWVGAAQISCRKSSQCLVGCQALVVPSPSASRQGMSAYICQDPTPLMRELFIVLAESTDPDRPADQRLNYISSCGTRRGSICLIGIDR
jgi:hypothetical protein